MIKTKRQKMKTSSVITKIFFAVLFALLVIYTVAIVGMLLWGVITSLKSRGDFTKDGNVLNFPNLVVDYKNNSREEFFKLKNYSLIFEELKFNVVEKFYQGSVLVNHEATVDIWTLIVNTLLYAGGGALIYAIMPALTAYLCAKYRYKLSSIIFVVYTFMMCMPIVGNYPTELTFLRNTGLYDTIWGNYIQKMTGSGMYFFVYFAFFKESPDTYREAAEIDGASELAIMLDIYFPLAIKMISTVFLIQFVYLWNDYQTPLLYLPTHPTLSYAVFELTKESSKIRKLQFVPVQVAGCMILAIPILVLYIIFKDKLMGNVSLGGIKE